jgi:hypothetical protein
MNNCNLSEIVQVNPLGNEVTLLSAVMLNLGQLLGAGIYSVPGAILSAVGSIGLLLVFWILAAIFSFGSSSVLEGVSMY